MHLQHRGGGRGVRVRRAQASRLFDLPLNIKVDAEFYNIEVDAEFFNVEVVEEFFCVEVVEEVFVFAAIRLLLRGCRAPPRSSRLQGSRSVFCKCLNETFL